MKVRVRYGRIAVAISAVAMLSVPALQASAATSTPAVTAKLATSLKSALPASGPAVEDVSSTVAPYSWQTNNTVWALAYSSNVVYVAGQFTSVRPHGEPLGTDENARTFLAAFSATTGALESFDPDITGASGSDVTALAVSPDGSTLYVGGLFNHVNGVYRDNLAAFNISTGALTSWAPAAFGKVLAIAPNPSGSEIYIGGDFNQLAGKTVTYAGAVTSTGASEPWAPVLNNSVTSIAVAPDDSQVVLGGYFTSFEGNANQNSFGVTDTTTGTTEYPAPNIMPNNNFNGGCISNAKDIIMGAATASDPSGTAYVAAEGTGGGCFDGDFAVGLVPDPTTASPDTLLWQNDCLGATQSLVIINNVLYKGSHAHDCAYEPGGFPQVDTSSGWVSHHLLDQSLVDGTLLHWTPDTSSLSGGLGPRAMATNGSSLFLGGDFVNVNGAAQQGFAIFPPGPDPQYPTRPSVAPTATSTTAGVVHLEFPAVSSRDVGTLTYSIYRDSGTKPIATLTATSWPWALPTLEYNDTGLVPGSSHTYSYTATAGTLVTAKSPVSAPVTVASASPTLNYQQTVLKNSPSFFWPLDETSGSVANDLSPNGFNGTYESGTTQGAAGPGQVSPSQTSTAFDGESGNVVSDTSVTGPQTFSIELWFKSSTDDGGKLIGFGNQPTGMSSNYDRHIYMMNDGQLVFGVYNSGTDTIETPGVYNDGQWHYAVATLGPSGMALYVDGQLVGTNSTTSAQAFSGYWRVGGDNLNGWNLDPWGASSQGMTEPASYYFQGDIADVAVYPTALTAAQVAAHYAAANANVGG
jgi:concanavalin A-like lectin/glucanase superfamily protein